MSARPYPFDPDIRDRVADLLYELLPALYRVRDQHPEGQEQLRGFLRVLAAPLAEVRQSIEELHADLFIDTCNDWVIPYLAELIGVKLIFPDASSNRRDIRGTVAWRRRKGTPRALEEMGSDISGQVVVTAEGWKRMMIAQDLNLLRPERVVPDVTRAILAEHATGPLDATFHALDPRSISASSGRYHPRHMTHWVHPTRLFPLRSGVARDLTKRKPGGDPLDEDFRYAFDPLGADLPLRRRRTRPEDEVATDRVPPMHFAEQPGDSFDQEGRSTGGFTVRLCGLPAAIAAPKGTRRSASRRAAHPALIEAPVTVTLLAYETKRLTGEVDLEILAAPATLPGVPNVGGAKVRGGVRVGLNGGTPLPAESDAVTAPVGMIRLQPVTPAKAAYFPGATIEIAGSAPEAALESVDPNLAAEGFLRGALVVEVPGGWVFGRRFFYLAADGSVYEAQSATKQASGDAPDVPIGVAQGGEAELFGDETTTGPGPAFPPLDRTFTQDRVTRVPSAPGRGPVVMHGAPVLERTDTGLQEAGDEPMALVFAARVSQGGFSRYEPILRLEWKGPHATAASSFTALASLVDGGGPTALQPRFAQIAALRDQRGLLLELVVRFEASKAGLLLPPCEVAWTSDDGSAVLIHLPTLETGVGASAAWASSLGSASADVAVGSDGSTRFTGSTSPARYALGGVAPLRGPLTLRRRRVRSRSLCQWRNETDTRKHARTPAGMLDIDPQHGLFAFALAERAPSYPTPPTPLVAPAAVTVDFLDGYSDHIGAHPDAREPLLDKPQARPTRLVTGSGHFHRGAPADWHEIPRYPTLTEALQAIEAGGAKDEVVQFEDSATYHEQPRWPPGLESLTLQAAESERPVLRLDAPWPPPTWAGAYGSLVLRGLCLGGAEIHMAPAASVAVELCTVTGATDRMTFQAPASGARIELVRSVTAGLVFNEVGTLVVRDSIVDAAGGMAISVPKGRCEIERTTVLSIGQQVGTEVMELEASEVIFLDRVEVRDRFSGCIRYSRAAPESVLSRRHRVTEVAPRFVSLDRRDAAHARLASDCPREVARGAEDGSEMGAFHGVRLGQRYDALLRRFVEFTPAGLSTGTIRLD